MESNITKKNKNISERVSKVKIPHTYVLLFCIMLVMAILTYIIPAGEFKTIKNAATGSKVIVPSTFKYVKSNPTSFFELFKAIPEGMQSAAELIFFVFIVGGSFQIINSTGTLSAFVGKTARSLSGREKLMIPIFLVLFSIGGAILGMSNEVIVFVPIGIALARELGYDAIVGTAMVTLGAACGFNAGVMNPFTVGVAQGIAGLPLFSGMGFRIVLLVVLLIITSIYIMHYAEKVKKDPSNSIVSTLEKDEKGGKNGLDLLDKVETKHYLVLCVLIIGFACIVFGVIKYQWSMTDLSAAFLAMSVISGLVSRMKVNDIAKQFVIGAKALTFGALVIGIAKAIVIILQDASVLDTIVRALSGSISGWPKILAVYGMYLIHIILHFIIPSGSGQAAVTMPLMIPIAGLVGIKKQLAVLAYQFGDGFTGSINPTSSNLNGYLSVSKISYVEWFKFIWPLILMWLGTGVVFLAIAQLINIGPF